VLGVRTTGGRIAGGEDRRGADTWPNVKARIMLAWESILTLCKR
jgi:hypothetical protein